MKTLSLFSGTSGMDVSFSKAGFDIAFANESNPHACSTYRTNHPNAPLFEGNITHFLTAAVAAVECSQPAKSVCFL